MVHEHWGENRSQRRDDVMGALGFVGLDHLDPRSKVGVLDARDRRLVEIARAVVGRPRLVLLDEPAAGLPDEETEHLGRGHPQHPRAHGRARDPRGPRHEPGAEPCSITAVLDFGKLIAAGPTAEVLRNEHVIKAYLGAEDDEL